MHKRVKDSELFWIIFELSLESLKFASHFWKEMGLDVHF